MNEEFPGLACLGLQLQLGKEGGGSRGRGVPFSVVGTDEGETPKLLKGESAAPNGEAVFALQASQARLLEPPVKMKSRRNGRRVLLGSK